MGRRSSAKLLRVGAVATGIAAALVACTIFNDAVVQLDGGAIDAAVDAPIDLVDAGTDADARTLSDAPETQPPTQYLSMADGVRLCVLAMTCPLLSESIGFSVAVPIDMTNFSLCLEWATGPIPASRIGVPFQQGVLQCMASAPSCAVAQRCSVFEAFSAGDPRCNVGPDASVVTGAFCTEDGGTAVDCTNFVSQHCDTGGYTPGATCNRDNVGGTSCSLGGVDAACPPSVTCASTFVDFCASTSLHYRENCATVGGVCNTSPVGGFITCGPACMAVASSCSGDVAIECDSIEQSAFDCANFGAKCVSMGTNVYCARPSDSCTPFDPAINVCTGSQITVCVGGTQSSFDCASIGKGCLPGSGGQSAHCG